MNNVFLLVKNYYRIFFTKLFKNRHRNLFLGFFSLIISIIFILMFAFLSYTTVVAASEAQMPTLAISSFTTTLLMFVLMLIVTESSPTNKHSDENMLLSFPFKKSEIIIAKVLYFFSFDFIIIFFLLFPSYVIYYMMVEGTSIYLVFRGFYVILASTMFATGVSSLISVFFNRITKSFKYSNIIKSFLSVFLVVLFIIFYLFFSYVSEDVEKSSKIYEFYLIKLISTFVENGNLLSFIVITLSTLIIFIISILVKSYYLGRSLNTYHSKNKQIKYNEKSVRFSLFKREISKYFSIPIYVSNTILGPLFIILISLIIVVIGKDYFLKMIYTVINSGYENKEAPKIILESIAKYFDIGLIGVYSLLLNTMPITASSISLEKKELWILKVHPISYKDVFLSKILVNVIINTIALLISCILLFSRIDYQIVLFLFTIVFIIILTSSIIGLYMNLLAPKLEWESEMEVVKQGSSIILSTVVVGCTILIPLIFICFLNFDIYFKLFILLFIYCLLFIFWVLLLNTKGKKLYNRL